MALAAAIVMPSMVQTVVLQEPTLVVGIKAAPLTVLQQRSKPDRQLYQTLVQFRDRFNVPMGSVLFLQFIALTSHKPKANVQIAHLFYVPMVRVSTLSNNVL